jgi:hypothetical protein
MAAISSLSAELTNRCLASVVFFSNCGDTMVAWKACPHPPAVYHQLLIRSSDMGQSKVCEPTRQVLDLDMSGAETVGQSRLERLGSDAGILCHFCGGVGSTEGWRGKSKGLIRWIRADGWRRERAWTALWPPNLDGCWPTAPPLTHCQHSELLSCNNCSIPISRLSLHAPENLLSSIPSHNESSHLRSLLTRGRERNPPTVYHLCPPARTLHQD